MGFLRIRVERKKKRWKVRRGERTFVTNARKKRWMAVRRDIGHKGKGSPTGVKIKVRKGLLEQVGYHVTKGESTRREALKRAVKKYGARSVWRMLNAQYVFRKNTTAEPQKTHAKIFRSDRDWVSIKYMESRD